MTAFFSLRGWLRDPKDGSPFVHLRAVVFFVALYAAGAFMWMLLGERVPGGRWFAIHLFTLGVLSNLVMALTHHFTATLLQVRHQSSNRARFVVLNAGGLAILGGFPFRWVLTAGVLAVTTAVLWLALDLRRMRRVTLQGRFAFVVRAYERAALAFLLGATLGLLMGVGVLGGAWYGAARLAHLHVNVLGWGGLTLLATVVFFGPTIMGTQTRPGAERTAARALGAAAAGLAVVVPALLLTGAGGDVAFGARLVAAGGLALYAAAATAVCLGVLATGRRAEPSGQSRFLRAACLWFPGVLWTGALVTALGELRLLDALGVALLVGVLGQAMLASLGHLAPVVRAGGPDHRAVVRSRLDRLPRARPLLLNLGVMCVVAAAVAGGAAGAAGGILIRIGWVLVAAVALSQLWLVIGSFRAPRLGGNPGNPGTD